MGGLLVLIGDGEDEDEGWNCLYVCIEGRKSREGGNERVLRFHDTRTLVISKLHDSFGMLC